MTVTRVIPPHRFVGGDCDDVLEAGDGGGDLLEDFRQLPVRRVQRRQQLCHTVRGGWSASPSALSASDDRVGEEDGGVMCSSA